MNKFTSLAAAVALVAGFGFSNGAKAQNIGFQVKDMDTSVKPGTDFYRYANGGWMKADPLTAEYSRFGAFDLLNENNNKQLRSLIEELAEKGGERGSLEQKIGDLFRLAMDSTTLNARGSEGIRPDLALIAGAKNKRELSVITAKLARKGVPSYFSIYIDADLRNSAMNIVNTYQGGLSMDERDYYVDNDEATVRIREAFKVYAVRMFELAGFDNATAKRKMEDVMRIETAIAEASYSATKQRDVEGNYHKMSYAELLSDFPGIDWSTLFLTIGYPAFDEINVSQPEPIKAVERIIAEESLDAQKSYAEFRLIDAAASALGDEFSETAFDFYGRTMSGRQEQRPRWKRAVSTVESVLGMAVGKIYVDRYFPPAAKERMLALVKNLQVALGERIDAQTWMDAATKAKAHEKLGTFYVKIGYPDKWRDYSKLDIDPSLTFWENLAKASEFATDYTIAKKANKPVDRDEWLMNPQMVNAYYNPTTNEICFPAGILQPPFFDMNADDATNYGAIGVVIGHEMTHGFDDQGRQFDKDGNLTDWWSKADGERFTARTKVMVDFFDKIQVLPDLHANGSLTLGENIADHGGLKVSFQAFQKATAGSPATKTDGFTPEQRFFLAYAHVWAQNIREEQVRVYTKSDPHSLGEWRVNGALPHIDAWYKAFDIKKGDPLFVPKNKRVDVW